MIVHRKAETGRLGQFNAAGDLSFKQFARVVLSQLVFYLLSQKQAVATLYVISAILGLSAVVLTTGGEVKALMIMLCLCLVGMVAAKVVFPKENKEEQETVAAEEKKEDE